MQDKYIFAPYFMLNPTTHCTKQTLISMHFSVKFFIHSFYCIQVINDDQNLKYVV